MILLVATLLGVKVPYSVALQLFTHFGGWNFRSSTMQIDDIADANGAGSNHFGKDALAGAHHPSAESLANGIHLSTRVARGVETQHGVADLNLPIEQGDKVDSFRGPDLSGNQRDTFGDTFR